MIKPETKKEERRTEFGIILETEGFEERPVIGEVVIGNKEVKKGDRVLFSKFGFDEVEINKTLHYVVSDVCILGKFT